MWVCCVACAFMSCWVWVSLLDLFVRQETKERDRPTLFTSDTWYTKLIFQSSRYMPFNCCKIRWLVHKWLHSTNHEGEAMCLIKHRSYQCKIRRGKEHWNIHNRKGALRSNCGAKKRTLKTEQWGQSYWRTCEEQGVIACTSARDYDPIWLKALENRLARH